MSGGNSEGSPFEVMTVDEAEVETEEGEFQIPAFASRASASAQPAPTPRLAAVFTSPSQTQLSRAR